MAGDVGNKSIIWNFFLDLMLKLAEFGKLKFMDHTGYVWRHGEVEHKLLCVLHKWIVKIPQQDP